MKGKLVKGIRLLCTMTFIFSLLLVGCGEKVDDKSNDKKVVKTDTAADDAKKKESDSSVVEGKVFDNKELDIAVFEGGYGRAFWDEIVKEFEAAYPGVKVTINANPKIGELIRPRLISGDAPDFIYLMQEDQSGVTMGLIKDKGIMDITDVFEEMAIDKNVPLKEVIAEGFLETKRCSPYDDGKIYLAPFNSTVTGLWYNKALFDEKGWKAPTTWDEFFAFGEKAKEVDRALMTYQGIYPGYLECILFPSIASAGDMEDIQKVFNYDVGAWKSEGATKATSVMQKIADNDYLLEGTVAMDHTQSQTEFLLGNALFCPNGSWFEEEMKDAPREDGFAFGFAGCPVFDINDQMYVNAGIEQMYIPKGAKNPELAKEFIKFLYTDKSVKLNAELTKGVMSVKGAVELCKEYIPVSAYNTYKIYDKGAKPLPNDFKAVPDTVNINVYDEIFNPIASIMNKSLTSQEWTDDLEDIYKGIHDAMK